MDRVQFNTITNPNLSTGLLERTDGKAVEVKDGPQDTFPVEAPTSQNDLSSSNVFNAKDSVDYDSLLDSEILDRVRGGVFKAALRKAEELKLDFEQTKKLLTFLPDVVFMEKEEAVRSKQHFYCILAHNVEINPFYIGNGKLDTPESDGFHEGSHAVNSILLSSLSDEEISRAIKTKVLDEIVEGSPVELYRGEFTF